MIGGSGAGNGFFPQHIGSHRANQRGQASADHIRDDASAQQVRNQAAHEQARDRRRRKEGQNRQRLRDARLDSPIADGLEHHAEHHVDSGNHGRLGHKQYLVCLHIQFSFSFVLRVEGLEHSVWSKITQTAGKIKTPESQIPCQTKSPEIRCIFPVLPCSPASKRCIDGVPHLC